MSRLPGGIIYPSLLICLGRSLPVHVVNISAELSRNDRLVLMLSMPPCVSLFALHSFSAAFIAAETLLSTGAVFPDIVTSPFLVRATHRAHLPPTPHLCKPKWTPSTSTDGISPFLPSHPILTSLTNPLTYHSPVYAVRHAPPPRLVCHPSRSLINPLPI